MSSTPRLVIASHNPGKLKEIAALLSPFPIRLNSAAELGLPEPEETGASFAENAYLKAHASAKATGLPALSDDSGLVIPALDGQPGIYSARWAGEKKDFAAAFARIEKELAAKGVDISRQAVPAYFVCMLCLAWPGGDAETFEGQAHGQVGFPPRGKNGFGYDPIFTPQGYTLTFGEMEPAAKDAISHRAAAFALLRDYLHRHPL